MSTREPQIFVSHSQYDGEIRRNFSEVFAVAGIRAKYMEFEQEPPAWREIKEQVRASEAVFLLLGPNIRRSYYTENWVAFEVGLACAFGKEVWVFEPEGLSVSFPVPYATDYLCYNFETKDHFNYVKKCIESYKSADSIFPIGVESRKKKGVPNGFDVTCQNPNCKLHFHLHKVQMPGALVWYVCPACRQPIILP